MKIQYTYRGNATGIYGGEVYFSAANGGGLLLSQRSWSDGNQKVYSSEIQPDELLVFAIESLKRLSSISGVDYSVFVDNGNSPRRISK